MKKYLLVLIIAVGLETTNLMADAINGFGPSASDSPITINAGWYGFCFEGPGSPATSGCQNDGVGVTGNPITFTTSVPVLFKITDAFDHGDTFDVNVNSGAITFTTPAVAVSDGDVSNPDLAFADPLYSHASVMLNPSSYSINVFAHASPFGGGGAYLEVVSAVPEPTTLLLLGSGIMAVVGIRLKTRTMK
jgi:hypothetical protein